MNIHELDSYDLGDAVKFNDKLNPRIWGADEKMRPEVREQLLRIADDFREFLGIDVEIQDITVSGSNAAYTYTPHSDIDLHLVVDLPEADRNEVYRELFDAKKYAYNDMHNIRIGGYDVELYVQDANKTHHSQGIYSIMNNDWVSVPKRRRPTVDDISVKSKFEDLGHRIELAIATGDYEKISAMAEKIREYRQAGLDAHGEFGPENLAFKILRTQGLIKKLYDARSAAKDELLSLDERRKKKKKKVRYGYGGYWYPGTAYAGQDHPAGTEGGDGGGDGGGESVREDAGMTWDGVNPTTDMFTSEDAGMTPSGVSPTTAMFTTETEDNVNEDILRDFIDFVVKQLKIEQMPRVKLRRDPQWPQVHKTFGRYNDDAKTLEVAWGQRHIMDVLRTVAHELTHKHQHEREGEHMGADAGETGSPYENEANARAGVLMRDYGRLHPEYFAVGQVHDLEEDIDQELSNNDKLYLRILDNIKYRSQDFLKARGAGGGRSFTPSILAFLKQLQQLGKENVVKFIQQSIAQANQEDRQTKGMSYGVLAQALVQLADQEKEKTFANARREYNKQKQSVQRSVEESASGYIPTRAQAKDPRYSMALTVDIKPGQVGKEANKLKLKTDRQGHPQVARANGLFEELMLEFQLTKEGIDAPISKTKDEEQYYKFIVSKAKMGRPLTRGEQDFVKMYQMYRQQKLAEFAANPERDDNDDVPDQLVVLANRWWNATDRQPQIEHVLNSLGWSIHQVESEDDAVQLQHRDGTTYFISADDFDPDLFEIGNSPEPHQPNSRRKNSLFHAEVDGQWVDVFFDRSDVNDTLHITFTVNQNHEPPDRGSNSASKSTFRILSTVRDVIKQKLPIYMKKGRRPPSVSITSKGDSRTSLYRRYFVPVIQDILGQDWQMTDYQTGGMTVFNWKPIKKLAEDLLNETQTVTRIDSKPITDFGSNLKSYKHTDDWSQSGIDTGDDSYWQKRDIKPKVSKGLYAGDPRRTALYATGNAHETRYVEFTQNGQPIVYFDRKDLPKMRARKTYLTVFDATNFKKLPTGEYFSDNPGQPIKQTEIGDPFQYIASQGWIVRVTENLDKVFKQVQAMHKAGKIAQYGAEGMNESQELDEVNMSPGALEKFAASKEAQGIRAGFEAELIFRDTQGESDEEDPEPDYDADERAYSIQQVIEFFDNDEYGYGLSSRERNRLEENLDETYMNWRDEQMMDEFRNEAEDLVRKVIEDEEWDWDDAVRNQLDDMGLSNDEIEEAMRVGRKAGRFNSSKEQEAYAQENPGYQRYLEAYSAAESILDDLVEESVKEQDKYWDAALDDFRDNWSGDDDSFFSDVDLRWMSDIANEYGLNWPVWNMGSGGNSGSRDWDEIGAELQQVVGMPVKVSSNYHSTPRKEGQWIVEPDGSLDPDDKSEEAGLEIVSPPMPLLMAIAKLKEVVDWANDPNGGNAYTNSSTGLHMGVSLPIRGGDVDYVKLILFMGDKYVLDTFGREANSFTASALGKLQQNIRGKKSDPAGVVELLRHGLTELAYKELQKGVGTSKYTSAHLQNGYIEFRSPGGDWLAKADEEMGVLENTMMRFARAMQIAGDPGAERAEYAKKLYKLVTQDNEQYTDQLRLFSEFSAGTINKEQLKKQWAEKTIGKQKEINQRWKLYQMFNGTWSAVPGQEYNGYTEDEAKNKVWSKYGREALDSGEYQLVNMGEQSWEVYDVNSGKTLEVVKGKSKGEVADAVYDKYVNQGIGFNVRPYEDPATMTPRAKLAKRIATKKTDYNYDIIDRSTVELRVVDRFYATSDQDASATFDQWLKSKDLPVDTDRYGYRKGRQAADDQRDSVDLQRRLGVQDVDTDVAQNFNQPQDATDIPRNWEFVNRINGQVIHNMTNASYNQANVVQTNLELRYPDADIYLRSVERPN